MGRGLRKFDIGKAAALVLCCCALVMAGCHFPAQGESDSQSRPGSSASQPSPSSSGSVPPSSSASQSSSSPSSSSSAPSSSMSSTSSASSEGPLTGESEAASQPESSDPGGGTDVPLQPESQEPSLWQLADVTIEKWVYGAETSRIYFRLANNSGEAMYIMRDYELERLEAGEWVPLGTTHRLDSQAIRYAVEPGQTRLVGVPVDWLKEPSERYGDDRIPEGYYRLRVFINQHFWRTAPFEVQADPLPEDTTFYEIRTMKTAYLTASPNVDYEVVNKTDQELSFSYRCFLEQWDGEVWRRREGSGSPDFTIIVGPRSVMRESFPLDIFHPLEPGQYRLVKSLARNYYYAPFTLVETLEELETPASPKEEQEAEVEEKGEPSSSGEGETRQEPQTGEGESEKVNETAEEKTESESSQPQETSSAGS